MKVLHLLQSNRFSGAENVVCQIINMFRDEPHVEMIYCCRKGPITLELQKRNIKYVPLDKLSIRELKKAIKQENPDIVHAHDVSAGVIAGLATVGTRCKVISHMHVNNENMSRFNLKTILYLISSIRYRHIFWVSESCFKGYRFKKFIAAKSIMLYNVMDKKNIYDRMQSDTNEYVFDIIYVGRLTYQKDPDRMIEVLDLVHKKKKDIKIAIVGTGNMYEHVVNITNEKKLSDIITFFGFIDNPLKMLSGSKLMLMTSRFEGLPMSVLEAMALGVPIVSTPVDGLLDVITNGEEGFLDNDDHKLAEHIFQIITDPELQKEMSVKAKKKFDMINKIDEYMQTLKKVYHSTIHQNNNKS